MSFLKFLENEAKRSRAIKRGNKIIWNEGKVKQRSSIAEFIDAYYLKISNADVIAIPRSEMDEIEGRIQKLESENKRLKNICDILKAALSLLIIFMLVYISLGWR